MDFAAWKDRKVLAGVLKTIYRAKDADAARAALEAFDASQRGQKYPAIAQSWRRNWERAIPFFAFPEAVRRILYTTDEIDEAVSLPTGSLSRARATSWRSAARRLQAPPGVLFVPCRIEALARFCFRRTRSPAIDEARGVAFRLLGQLLLLIAQRLDVISVGRTAPVALVLWVAGLKVPWRGSCWRPRLAAPPQVVLIFGQPMPTENRQLNEPARRRRSDGPVWLECGRRRHAAARAPWPRPRPPRPALPERGCARPC